MRTYTTLVIAIAGMLTLVTATAGEAQVVEAHLRVDGMT